MTQPVLTMGDNVWDLEYYSENASKRAAKRVSRLPPPTPGVQVIGLGTAGARVTQLTARYWLERIRQGLATAYLDYPIPGISPIPVRFGTDTSEELCAEPFCPVGEPTDRRDRARQFDLLRRRYSQDRILRGIAVYEDRKLGMSGAGGGAIPSVTALDIDLNIVTLYTFLQEQLRWLYGSHESEALSDLGGLIVDITHQEQRNSRMWNIVLVGGGAGATGNALLQIMPWLVRRILREMGIANYRLIGVVLGPTAFKGLTPYIVTNYRALLYSLDHMAHHGLHREFINGLKIDMDLPPYDHVFLIDDSTLPSDAAGRATEAGLDDFYNRSARAIGVMLSSNAWETVLARAVNADAPADAVDDGRLRWLTTMSVATAGVDKPALIERAIRLRQAQLLQELAERLAVHEATPASPATQEHA